MGVSLTSVPCANTSSTGEQVVSCNGLKHFAASHDTHEGGKGSRGECTKGDDLRTESNIETMPTST